MKNLFVALGIALLTISAHAQTNRTAADARRVFDEMRAKYAAFETYSHSLAPEEVRGESGSRVAKFSFQHPNRFATTYKDSQRTSIVISNGRTVYSYNSTFNKTKYHAKPMPPAGLGRVSLLQYDDGNPLFFNLILAGVDPYAPPWGEPAKSFSFGRPIKVKGLPVDTIVVQRAGPYDEVTTYFIGQKDRLLHGFEHTGGSGESAYTIYAIYSDIHVNQKIPIDTFAFVPPPNTQQENIIATLQKKQLLSESVKVGAVAPPIEGRDLKGRPIRLGDFKGKVVLLSFWTTWGWPTIIDTSFIKAAYEKFHNQGFEVIGISFDEDRKELEKYVRENKLPWPQLFDSKMYEGKMFEGSVNKDYKVRVIPTYLLIGRDGKIAEFNPSRLLLEPAIEKALSAPTPE